MEWFNVHQHSKMSVKDALPEPYAVVARASKLGYPAVALTDHGTLAGIPQLYTAAKQHDMPAVPGQEFYIKFDAQNTQSARMHMVIVATSTMGWRNLVRLNNIAARQSFAGYPTLEFDNLARMSEDPWNVEGLACFTGCLNGPIARALSGPAPETAANLLHMLETVFRGRVFIEVMNHGIETSWHSDRKLCELLVKIADEFSLPVVATADSHYTLREHTEVHNTMKQLTSWSKDPDEAQFHGTGYWMLSQEEAETAFGADIMDRTEEGLTELMKNYDLRIVELDDFTVKVPQLPGVRDPNKTLRERTTPTNGALLRSKPHLERLEHELEVISNAGFAPYMLLVAEVCEYMRKENILFSARGSASGSLVCYLLGITSFDPLKYKLRFDRFLSGDRLKPPDIDLDVDSSRREKVLDWLASKYSVRKIGTWSKLGMSERRKGSLMVKWKSWARKVGRDPESATDFEIDQLHKLSDMHVYGNSGVHAAGVVVVDDDAMLDQIPQTWITSSKTMVTAFDGNDIESMGYVKIDLLAVTMLDTVQRALDMTGVILADIPWRDDKVFRRIAKGNTHSLFQIGGWSARKGCQQLKPSTFADLVAAMALFRPAVTGSEKGKRLLYDFIGRRRGNRKIPQLHPIIGNAVKDTYGIFLYQESVLEVLRAIGMDAETLTKTLKAIKSSNSNVSSAKKTMNDTMKMVRELCREAGISGDSLELFTDALHGYSEYGFNKSHAVAYARWAFVTAWLATYHPAAWWCAELSTCAADKEIEGIRAAREDGINILAPDVNQSQPGWVVGPNNSIRRGLASLHGVGDAAAADIAAHAPYTDVSDLCERTGRAVTGRKNWLALKDFNRLDGTMKALHDAGALNTIRSQT